MKKTIISCSFLCLLPVLATAANFEPPKPGTRIHFNSSLSGTGVTEVIATDSDRFTANTSTAQRQNNESTRLFGILTLGQDLKEGVLVSDAKKAAQLFPLAVGKKTAFSSYGTTNGNRWFREHVWEVVSEYTATVDSAPEKIFVLNLKAESPGFFKMDATCDYSPRFGICLKGAGDMFIRNSNRSGRFISTVTKIETNGRAIQSFELTPTAAPAPQTSKPQSAPTEAPTAPPVAISSLAPAPAPAPAPTTPPVPLSNPNAEQRLRQAKELLDKKLITQQQYDEFVIRIMKDL